MTPASDVTYVALQGEVDLASADEIRARLEGAIDDAPPMVVIDLSAVDLIDSTGLGVLIDAARNAGDACEVALLAPGGLQLRGVLALAGVLEHLTVFESKEEIAARPS